MNPMLFTLFLLLILPAILWAVPCTRRMTGSWIAALKSVPAGCAVMIALPAFLLVLIRELPHRLRGMISSPLTDLIVSLMGIIAGIALIVFLLRFIYRKFHAEGKRSPLPAVIVFLFLGTAFPILSCVYTVVSYQTAMINYQTACDSGKRYYSSDWRKYELPPENGTEIAFEERGIHPFLAEYDYRLRFEKNGECRYHYLPTNCGGRTYFKLYRLKDGRLLFSDKDGDYIVDAADEKVWFLFRFGNKTYAVEYPNAQISGRGWEKEENGEVIVHFYNESFEKSSEAQLLTDELQNKSYYGCITNDFYPASERSEEPIRKMR